MWRIATNPNAGLYRVAVTSTREENTMRESRFAFFVIGILVMIGFLVMLGSTVQARPEFTIGSDPYETIFAYPHDILRWPSRAGYFEITPRTLPWQGNVTNVNSRPSDSYTSNYQDVTFAPPSDYQGDPSAVYSWAKISSYMHQNGYSFGAVTDSRLGRFLLQIDDAPLSMELEAKGIARAPDPSGTGYVTVPFSGTTRGDQDHYGFTLIHARQFFGSPVGLKVSYNRNASSQPGGFTEFTRDGIEHNVSHLTWGWATQGCNHIFGYPGVNVDAFYQNEYTVFGGHQWDLQVSCEPRGNWKSGLRYRTTRDDGETYGWSYDDGSTIEGAYHSDPYWKDRKTGRLLRGYTKARFYRRGDLDAGMLFLMELDSDASLRLNKLTTSEADSRQGSGGFVLETNPWFNYAMKPGYIDFGLLCELGRSGLKNTEARWNDASHSEQRDVIWSTQPYPDWSPYWETFSKGRTWFMATGFEADASIEVHNGWSALMRTTILRKYTRTRKLYGNSEIPSGGTSFEFFQTHRRDDYRNEMWMTGAFGVSRRLRSVTVYLTEDFPTAYLLKQTTKLVDSDHTLFQHEQRRTWQVQVPSGTRLFLVYALTP
jgi:hypothetical protein